MGIQAFTLATFGQATKGSKAQLKAKWCGVIFQTQPWWDLESSCDFSLAIPNPLFFGVVCCCKRYLQHASCSIDMVLCMW